jgi:Uma2 family endonuclease
MSHAVTDLPRRHRLTVADYYRMAEVGILAPDARVELIDGEIIDMAPPGSLHAATVDRLARILMRAAGDAAIVRVQNPVRLSLHSEPQPDLALLRPRDDFYAAHHPLPPDALLVVEVADSSLHFDRDTKMRLYAQNGVPEAWLVDLRNRKLIRHCTPRQDQYTVVDEPDLAGALRVAALPEIVVDLRGLFGG